MVDEVLEEMGRQKGEVSVVGNGGVQKWEDLGRLTGEAEVQGWMVGEELMGDPRSVCLLRLAAGSRGAVCD